MGSKRERRRVAVIGAGVAGLSTAHHLAGLGYEVHLVERRPEIELGGKAWSYDFPDAPDDDGEPDDLHAAAGMPAEHGFRFFPGFYSHVIDTMRQIPCDCDGDVAGSDGPHDHHVSDHLVELGTADIVRSAPQDKADPDSARDVTRLRMRVPTEAWSPSVAEMACDVLPHVSKLPDPREMLAAARVLTRLVTACPERWLDEYEARSWWDMSEAWVHGPRYSEWFAKGLTRTFVATKAEEMSGRTGGKILLQLLYDVAFPDGRSSADRVLDGPTSRVWIEPWKRALVARGVVFHCGHELTGLTFTGDLVTAIDTRRTKHVDTLDPAPPDGPWDHVVLAISVKTLKTLLSCELSELVVHDPGLLGIFNLHTRWMSGAFFYLTDADLGAMAVDDLPLGHTILLDSEWALTMIEQRHVWEIAGALDRFPELRETLDEVVAILSVDVSDWDSPGDGVPPAERPQPADRHLPTAGDRTDLRDQIWKQIRRHFPLLAEETPTLSAIDISITINERRLDPPDDTPDAAPTGPPSDEVRPRRDRAKKRHNADELLVNTTQSWKDRPGTVTKVPNLFMAGDYVRTNTDFASMEAADESGRRAANAILERDGRAAAIDLWPLRHPDRWWFNGVRAVATQADRYVAHPLRLRAPFRLPLVALTAGAAIDGTLMRLFRSPSGPARIVERTDGSPDVPVRP